jgi:hypothetical protein
MSADRHGATDVPGENGWKKSSYSVGNASCVEVNVGATTVLLRDSKEQRKAGYLPADDPTIEVSAEVFDELIGRVAAGAEEVAAGSLSAETRQGGITLSCAETGVELSFTAAEWEAFRSGAADGEFTP